MRSEEKMDKTKILVVDDESRMRKLVKDFLVRQGYRCDDAEDGWMAGLSGDPYAFKGADHHADGKIGRAG